MFLVDPSKKAIALWNRIILIMSNSGGDGFGSYKLTSGLILQVQFWAAAFTACVGLTSLVCALQVLSNLLFSAFLCASNFILLNLVMAVLMQELQAALVVPSEDKVTHRRAQKSVHAPFPLCICGSSSCSHLPALSFGNALIKALLCQGAYKSTHALCETQNMRRSMRTITCCASLLALSDLIFYPAPTCIQLKASKGPQK